MKIDEKEEHIGCVANDPQGWGSSVTSTDSSRSETQTVHVSGEVGELQRRVSLGGIFSE